MINLFLNLFPGLVDGKLLYPDLTLQGTVMFLRILLQTVDGKIYVNIFRVNRSQKNSHSSSRLFSSGF